MGELKQPMDALAEAASKGAVDANIKNVGPAAGDKIGEQTVAVVAANPVLMNELNQESPVQSRLTWIGSGGILVAVFYVGREVMIHGLDLSAYKWGDMEEAALVLVPALLTLYARWYPKLKPLFWRRWWWPW